MNSHTRDFGDLHERLVALEKQNRRFKQLGATLLILVASLAVLGQAPSKKTVEANEFILKDFAGKARARLAVSESSVPYLELLDGMIRLKNTESKEGIYLTPQGISFGDSKTEWVEVVFGKDRLKLVDAEGYSATLGVTDLSNSRTGEKRKTSAASLILVDKDKNILWKAP